SRASSAAGDFGTPRASVGQGAGALDAVPPCYYDISAAISLRHIVRVEEAMCSQRGGFDFGAGFPFWGRGWGGWGPRRGRGRRQMFEAGEIKFVILRLLKEKP